MIPKFQRYVQSALLSGESSPQLGPSGKYLGIVAKLPAQWSGVGVATLAIGACLTEGVIDLDLECDQLLGSLSGNLSELYILRNFSLICSLHLLVLAFLSSNLEGLDGGITGALLILMTSGTDLLTGILLFFEAHSWGLYPLSFTGTGGMYPFP